MTWINKFLTKIGDKIAGIIAVALVAGVVSFTAFAFTMYRNVTETVPGLTRDVKAIEDTIKKIENRPAKIERKVGLMEKDVEYIKADIKKIEKNVAEQQQDTKEILKLLIQIKNGN